MVTGALVGVVRDGLPTIWRRARTDGSYLSAGDARVHVGLGDQPRVSRVVVQWPDNVRESYADVPPDRIVTLRRGEGRPEVRGL